MDSEMSARILQFPNLDNPTAEDIPILMRASIKLGYTKVVKKALAHNIVNRDINICSEE